MSLQYIIDGYNLTNHPLFNQFSRKKINDVRLRLAALIVSRHLTGSKKNKVYIVFDGFPNQQTDIKQNSEDAEVSVLYSRQVSADEKIKHLVESSSNVKSIVVVSNDKEIQFCIRSLGARAISVEDFFGGSKEQGGKEKQGKGEVVKPELTFSQINEINNELKKIWLT